MYLHRRDLIHHHRCCQVRGHRSASGHVSSWSSSILLSLTSVLLLMTGSLVDAANLNPSTAVIDSAQWPLKAYHQLNSSINLPSRDDDIVVVGGGGKSVPLSITTKKSANISAISDTNQANYHAPMVHGVHSLNSSRNVDSSNFAQNQETSHAHQDDIHDTFLLMCSANSIRYWSVACPAHRSQDLLTHSRSSAIKRGITNLALWRPDHGLSTAELIWYDVNEHQFHRAAIQRQHLTDCDNLLGIEFNQTLDYGSNPFANQSGTFLKEASVKLAIDNTRQLLFASNYMQNRIDVYRLDSATVANNEMVWLASVDSHRPYDIAVDEERRTVFWLEKDRKQICHLSFHFEDEQFLQLNRDLTSLVKCTGELISTVGSPEAITLNLTNKTVLWGDANGHIYCDSYGFTNHSRTTKLVGSSPGEAKITNLAMLTNGTLFLAHDTDVHTMDVATGHFDLKLIEANHLFGLLLVDNLSMVNPDITTTVVPTAGSTDHLPSSTSTTTKPISTTTTKPSVPSPQQHTHTSSSTRRIVLLTLVPLILLLVILAAMYLFCCRHGHHHQFVHELRRKFEFGHSRSRLFKVGRRFTQYNQLRKNRANSTGRDQLIEDDIGDFESQVQPQPQQPQQHRAQYFRQNIANQMPASAVVVDDIEDIFGGSINQNHHHQQPQQQHRRQSTTHRPCITCRDQDICQDKGICMATYRVL